MRRAYATGRINQIAVFTVGRPQAGPFHVFLSVFRRRARFRTGVRRRGPRRVVQKHRRRTQGIGMRGAVPKRSRLGGITTRYIGLSRVLDPLIRSVSRRSGVSGESRALGVRRSVQTGHISVSKPMPAALGTSVHRDNDANAVVSRSDAHAGRSRYLGRPR